MRMRMLVATVATAGLTALGLLGATTAADASGSKLSQDAAHQKFIAAGITHSSSGDCSTRSNPSCTSYEQINSGTVNGIISFHKASNCAVNITGGTEVGHASGTFSHYNGYKLDIAHRTCTDNYVKNHYKYIGLRGDGFPQWQTSSGNLWCDEGSHWDITYF